MADDLVSSFGIEEIKSLTVAKLKAELTRLNQPLGNLKRKADYVEALTIIVEKGKKQPCSESQEKEGAAEELSSRSMEEPSAEADDEGHAEEVEEQPPLASEGDSGVTDSRMTSHAPITSDGGPGSTLPKETQEMRHDTVSAEVSKGEVSTASQDGEKPPVLDTASKVEVDDIRDVPNASKSVSDVAEQTGSNEGGHRRVEALGDRGDEDIASNGEERRGPDEMRKARNEGESKQSLMDIDSAEHAGKRELRKDGQPESGEPETKRSRRSREGRRSSEKKQERHARRHARRDVKSDDMDETDADIRQAKQREPPSKDYKTMAHVETPQNNSDAGSAMSEERNSEELKSNQTLTKLATIRVDNFVRPFTAAQAKKLLEDKAGESLVDDGFWMDKIKTHCYATFSHASAAHRAVDALQGLQWPERSSKRLEAKVANISAMEAKAKADEKLFGQTSGEAPVGMKTLRAGTGSYGVGSSTSSGADAAAGSGAGTLSNAALMATDKMTPVVRGRGSVQAPGVKGRDAETRVGANGDAKKGDIEEPPMVLDELFRKTSAKPALYWLPLSEEEVGERKKKMKEDNVGPRTIPLPVDSDAVSGGNSLRNGSRGDWGRRDRGFYAGGGAGRPQGRYAYGNSYYGRAGRR